MNKLILKLTFLSVIFLTSCATIFTPNRSKLVIYNGYPKNAEIFLNNQKIGVAPLEIWVENHKLDKHNVLEIKSEGFQSAKIDIDLKTDAGYFIFGNCCWAWCRLLYRCNIQAETKYNKIQTKQTGIIPFYKTLYIITAYL